jgi:hypothetical protein
MLGLTAQVLVESERIAELAMKPLMRFDRLIAEQQSRQVQCRINQFLRRFRGSGRAQYAPQFRAPRPEELVSLWVDRDHVLKAFGSEQNGVKRPGTEAQAIPRASSGDRILGTWLEKVLFDGWVIAEDLQVYANVLQDIQEWPKEGAALHVHRAAPADMGALV